MVKKQFNSVILFLYLIALFAFIFNLINVLNKFLSSNMEWLITFSFVVIEIISLIGIFLSSLGIGYVCTKI